MSAKSSSDAEGFLMFLFGCIVFGLYVLYVHLGLTFCMPDEEIFRSEYYRRKAAETAVVYLKKQEQKAWMNPDGLAPGTITACSVEIIVPQTRKELLKHVEYKGKGHYLAAFTVKITLRSGNNRVMVKEICGAMLDACPKRRWYGTVNPNMQGRYIKSADISHSMEDIADALGL